MAVAGLHNVSVCDSAPNSIRWGDEDRPSSRTSSIMKMWRELEGEHVMSRPAIKVGKRQGQFTSQTSDSDDFGSLESLDGTSSFGTVTTDDNGNRSCLQSLSGSDNGHSNSNSFSSSQSNCLGESARKRVRKIFHEWKNTGVNSRSPNASHKNNRPRPQWLGQSECERVRSVIEWVQNGGYGFANHKGVHQQGSKREHIQEGRMVSCREVTRQLCGREAIHDMLARFQSERKKEILCVLKLRAVSDFAHHNCIQSLLRGRFLMNRRLVQEERPASDALSELGLLRKINTVSTMREGFLSKLNRGLAGGFRGDAICLDDYEDLKNQHPDICNDSEVQCETDSPSNSGNFQIELSCSKNTPCNRITDKCLQECGTDLVRKMEGKVSMKGQKHETSLYEHICDWHSRANGTLESWLDDNIEAWSGGISADTRGLGRSNFLEARDAKYESSPPSTGTHDDDEVGGLLPFDLVECSTSNLDTCTWLDVEYGQEAGSAEMSNSFYLADGESIQSMELRQLQKRKRVSGLLRSGFRERLDQLIHSFVQRQNDTSTEWEGDESSSSHASLEEEQDRRHNLDNRVQLSWAQEMLPWEIIKELRTGMAILHERVNNMENMLKTCMNKGGLLHHLRPDC